jgi:hypothetical protein
MTDKTLIGIGVVVVITPLAAFLYFGVIGGEPLTPAPGPVAAKSAAAPAANAAPVVPTRQEAALAIPPPARDLTAAQRHVTPVLIENLAHSVRLEGNESRDVGTKKEMWVKVLPVAQALVEHSDADCEQHNWLVRFVECGQQALANSPDYYGSANSLAEMPRDQQEAQTGLPSN